MKKGKKSSSGSGVTPSFVNSPFELLGTDDDPLEAQMEPEFQLAFKALNKKDPTTKLKALQELTNLFKTLLDDHLHLVLKHWVFNTPFFFYH